MSDFTYRSIHVEDTWTLGSLDPHSQTRFNWNRRLDGSQRWLVHHGQGHHTFTQAEAKALIDQLF